MEIPFPSLNVNMTEMNEDRVARKLDEDYARRVDALSKVDVFRALDAEKIDRLARGLRMAIFGPGEVILRQGDPGDSLYLVRTGRVALELATRGGGRREIATLSPGQFFGEMSLMTGESRSAIVDKGAFQQILEEKPELAGVISDILTHRQLSLEGTNMTPVGLTTESVQKNHLRTRIAAFFGIKMR
jgi:CRP-like cAMP-binding protein